MEIVRIGLIGIITAFCVMITKDSRSDIALLIGIAGGLIILLSVVEQLFGIFAVFSQMAQKTGVSTAFVGTLIKIVGIGYVVDFSAGICEDAGSRSLADKIVLCGKITIMFLSLPIVTALFDLIYGLI